MRRLKLEISQILGEAWRGLFDFQALLATAAATAACERGLFARSMMHTKIASDTIWYHLIASGRLALHHSVPLICLDPNNLRPARNRSTRSGRWWRAAGRGRWWAFLPHTVHCVYHTVYFFLGEHKGGARLQNKCKPTAAQQLKLVAGKTCSTHQYFIYLFV